ncbi:rubrerythrin [Bacteroides pyogenes F0041]|uniref:Rubrerythrin n=3 Tax=Bacteroides TaxID=816 RepID=U2DPW0_9BACE|nr:rubrerythrin [Bacteroides pyogenes F0041]GAE20750.1 rubrerythrin [Bacteroides pyogenes JCM 10003]
MFIRLIEKKTLITNKLLIFASIPIDKGTYDKNPLFFNINKIMTKSIKGTQTEKNLLTSFAGESQARMRYTYFASVAKKEGYEQISAIFTETADQEKEHAKRMFKFLEGGMVEITASYPAGVIGTTLENLRAAAAGEHEEWALDYPHFADVAEKEGFQAIAAMYRNIAIAEKAHEERYLAFVNNIENMTVFAKEGEVVWQCRNCGYVTVGKEAPKACPACLHPQAHFEVKKENY